jgi:hypothetical protein
MRTRPSLLITLSTEVPAQAGQGGDLANLDQTPGAVVGAIHRLLELAIAVQIEPWFFADPPPKLCSSR